jgi:hypothetical protein
MSGGTPAGREQEQGVREQALKTISPVGVHVAVGRQGLPPGASSACSVQADLATAGCRPGPLCPQGRQVRRPCPRLRAPCPRTLLQRRTHLQLRLPRRRPPLVPSAMRRPTTLPRGVRSEWPACCRLLLAMIAQGSPERPVSAERSAPHPVRHGETSLDVSLRNPGIRSARVLKTAAACTRRQKTPAHPVNPAVLRRST